MAPSATAARSAAYLCPWFTCLLVAFSWPGLQSMWNSLIDTSFDLLPLFDILFRDGVVIRRSMPYPALEELKAVPGASTGYCVLLWHRKTPKPKVHKNVHCKIGGWY